MNNQNRCKPNEPQAEELVRLYEKAADSYYHWIRNLLSLAVLVLTMLVSFQKNYIYGAPQYLFLLQSCWAALALGILAGAVHLYGEIDNRLRIYRAESAKAFGVSWKDEAVLTLPGHSIYRPKLIFRLSMYVFFSTLAYALLSLSAFAILD